ncbi:MULTISPECIES: UvrB/UvrC motif-containing protein [Peptoniphilus]|jgi:uvrB/uvrC protein|uniref:UvrB/UvrC motif-containing protein n=1 Tax=Peptoniphilus TaxID=162289 RepID=UPI0002899F0E|nr:MULTISPECIES: UvrB/UvrC motif-containing protein [Peptoniphilus]MBS6610101.1 UvrB/UvrC motif-containing protein [Peptoniphilus harei]MDU1043409.1 UvrB/UvrC motif-containing protein [Peptoniphilus rhinitidis]MDU1954125.1 UvrB/UvrC motif-containing protein [Peptoniphilus lacydonensis]MDU2110400.1 UvrB/UvrC motif-containing protein [Peptoniphilus lacydonensis]MDU2115860.1 UvrB/UvrC motif-containing protein [Peptoniphilus lacydonensis]
MLCDNCKERESVISYTKINDNEIEEVHLCEVCAEEKLKKEFQGYKNIIPQLENALKNIFKFTANYYDEEDIACEFCGTKFSELKNTGTLGCPKCYESFGEEIKKYLKTINIDFRYRGKIPKNAESYIIYNRKLDDLKSKLELAINLEEYEKAAELRDEIKKLKEDVSV